MTRTSRDFEKRARARLNRWIRKNGYRSDDFVIRFDRCGNVSERSLYVVVKRVGSNEVHDVNYVHDYPGIEEIEIWLGERPTDLTDLRRRPK